MSHVYHVVKMVFKFDGTIEDWPVCMDGEAHKMWEPMEFVTGEEAVKVSKDLNNESDELYAVRKVEQL